MLLSGKSCKDQEYDFRLAYVEMMDRMSDQHSKPCPKCFTRSGLAMPIPSEYKSKSVKAGPAITNQARFLKNNPRLK